MPIDLLVAPVSGGYFISQVAIIATLLEARGGQQFDINCGASGGNIACYIASLFDKTSESMEKITYSLNSDMFLDNWWATNLEFIPSMVIGIFKSGGIYKPGYGSELFVKHIFTTKIINASSTPEIWSLAFNLKDYLSELFCSKGKDKSILSKYITEEMLLEAGCQKTTYCDGDLDLITSVITASAALPPLRPPVLINKVKFTDGGVSRSSPGFLFSEALYELRNDPENSSTYGTGGVHYFYIYPFDLLNKTSRNLDIRRSVDNSHWISEIIEIINSTTVNSRFADRQSLMENWLRITGLARKNLTFIKETKVNVKMLKTKLDELSSKHYFIVFYTKDAYIKINKFAEKELREQYNIAKNSITYEIYHN